MNKCIFTAILGSFVMYIYQQNKWPNFYWQASRLISQISEVRMLQGRMLGKLTSLGFELQDLATIEAMSLEIVKSNAIEGQKLNREDVRSSIAKKLGKNWESKKIDRSIEGFVEVMFDALRNAGKELTHERLYSWQAAMFPTGYSGMSKVKVGSYRNTPGGEMVVESANYNRPVIHFKAPNDEYVYKEMDRFIRWFNSDSETEPITKSGIAHLWFVTIHPFEDGNGRIARIISDVQLARSDTSEFRFYSVSDEIEKNRKQYYDVLEKTQKGGLDITEWLTWYNGQVKASLLHSEKVLKDVIKKSEFWIEYRHCSFNERQKKMINQLFDGFEGKLSTSKWAKICKCSEDTALRDINELIKMRILSAGKSGGRSSYYYLKKLGDVND